MENQILRALEGLQVTNATKIHDYVQIALGDAIGISIYNDIIIEPNVNLSNLVNRRIESTTYDKWYITFIFTGGIILRVDLHPQAYHGPEALELNRKDFPPVVWR